MLPEVRAPGKKGLWYPEDPSELDKQLQGFLNQVPNQIDGFDLPIPGARVIIAPHAGYTYSGKAAAWAYKSLDLTQAKRVFILGPSHTFYLRGCAVTGFTHYGTPFGNLEVDEDVIKALQTDHGLPEMPEANDSREHSLEMQLPYLWDCFVKTFDNDPSKFPTVVPILIGDGSKTAERKAASSWLLPYLQDQTNAFIVSSDFCHWGEHFDYTPYAPLGETEVASGSRLRHLSSRTTLPPDGLPIHETIKALDDQAMEAVESGSYERFYDNLTATKNTVCGRHPIGVMMAALELLAEESGAEGEKCKFRVVRYERSNLVKRPDDFSVSYVSAYAIV